MRCPLARYFRGTNFDYFFELIKAKLSYLQAGPLEKGPKETWFLSHPAESQVQLQVELIQIQARQVAHLDLLQMPPQPFHRVQVRRVRRQRLQVDRVAGLRHEFLDLGSSVNRRPVPDHQQPVSGEVAQMDEELDAMQPVQRLRSHE